MYACTLQRQARSLVADHSYTRLVMNTQLMIFLACSPRSVPSSTFTRTSWTLVGGSTTYGLTGWIVDVGGSADNFQHAKVVTRRFNLAFSLNFN